MSSRAFVVRSCSESSSGGGIAAETYPAADAANRAFARGSGSEMATLLIGALFLGSPDRAIVRLRRWLCRTGGFPRRPGVP